MGKFVDLAKVAVIKIFFGDSRNELLKLWLIFWQNRAEQAAFTVFQFYPLFQLMWIRAHCQPALVIAFKRRDIQRDVQRGKFTARSQQRMNVQTLNFRAIDNQVGNLHQKLAQACNIQWA